MIIENVRLVSRNSIGNLHSVNNDTELLWTGPNSQTESFIDFGAVYIDESSLTALFGDSKILHFDTEEDLIKLKEFLSAIRKREANGNSELDEATLNLLEAFSKVPKAAKSLINKLRGQSEDVYLYRPRSFQKVHLNPWILDKELELPDTRIRFGVGSQSLNLESKPKHVQATMIYNSGGTLIKNDEERVRFWKLVLLEEQPNDQFNYKSLDETVDSDDFVRIKKDLHRLGEVDEVILGRLETILQIYCTKIDAETGYVQGMADLALPFAQKFSDNNNDDSINVALECFCSLMKRLKSNFSVGHSSIDSQLKELRDLIHETNPLLSDYLKFNTDSDNLFFAYRWLLVLFRREFRDIDRLWDVILAADACGVAKIEEIRIYLALAMILSQKKHFMRTCLRFEDLLKYFNDLSGKWDLNEILQLTDQLINHFKSRKELK